jgi:hypothetical protein
LSYEAKGAKNKIGDSEGEGMINGAPPDLRGASPGVVATLTRRSSDDVLYYNIIVILAKSFFS